MLVALTFVVTASVNARAETATPALDEVTDLPGYGHPRERTLAGFVDVNTAAHGNLFYMFFEQQGAPASPSETPLVVWLNGGPGASSALGNFLEHGPYRLHTDLGLVENPTSWNLAAHMLYFDQPVGTGYSYCDADGYVTNLTDLSRQFAAGLLHFFQLHPEYKPCQLFISGESYAGVYVPAIAAHILEQVPQLKLQGVLIGNPGNFHYTQYFGQIEFARVQGMIGDSEVMRATDLWNKCETLMERKETALAFQACENMSSYIFERAGNPFLYDIRQWGDVYDEVLAPAMQKYLEDPKVKDALHARNQTWKNGDGTSAPNPVVNALRQTLMDSVIPYLNTVLARGVPLLVYDGVFDGSSCNHLSVFNALRLLDWSGKDTFFGSERVLWTSSQTESGTEHPWGHVQTGGGLSFVWVANSGHLVPTDQPEAALQLLRMFLQNRQGLNSYHDFLEKRKQHQQPFIVVS